MPPGAESNSSSEKLMDMPEFTFPDTAARDA
jgi:hypothetical protein